MNKNIVRVSFVLIFTALSLVSCHKKDKPLLNEDRIEAVSIRATEVKDIAETVFLESSSIDDMKERLDEIRALDGVESVSVSNDAVVISIKDWGRLGYSFDFSEDNSSTINSFEETAFNDAYEKTVNTRSSSWAGSACIMNAQHQEREWTREIVNKTERMFQSCGIDVGVVNYPSLFFYRTEIYKYSLVFIIGHGVLSDGLHWLETSEDYEFGSFLERRYLKIPNVNYPEDEVMVFGKRVKFNGEYCVRYRYYISELFISNSTNSFEEKNNTVIFMVPCHSLEGDKYEDHDRSIDPSLADAFFEKGAGLYIGYDESSCWNAQKGGMVFIGKLLSGESFNAALNEFPDDTYRFHQHRIKDGFDRNYDVAMHALPSNGFKTNSFMMSPSFLSFDDLSADGYHFVGQSYYCPPITLNYFDESFVFINKDKIKYGFRISKSDNINSGSMYQAVPTWEHDVAPDSYLMSFKLDLAVKDLEADTKYYAWPYMINGQEINYGERFDFTTKRINRVIPEEIIDQMDDYIPIYEGNNPPNVEGQYLLSPSELVYDSTHGFNIGHIFDDLYFQFLNQDMDNNTLDYVEEQGNSSQVGTGAFISGEGDRFSVFFNTDGNAVYDDYSFWYKTAVVISGIKTAEGIKELDYAFVMVDKGDDPKPYYISRGSFRVFKDGDGLSTNTNYFSRRTSAPLKPMSYNPTPLPSMFEVEHN